MKQPIDPINQTLPKPATSLAFQAPWLEDLEWSSPGWSPIFDITLQPGEGLFFPPGMVSWFNHREGTGHKLPATGQQKEKSHKLIFSAKALWSESWTWFVHCLLESHFFFFKALFLTSKTVGYFWILLAKVVEQLPITPRSCEWVGFLLGFIWV